jgi:hypothetical protein
MNNKSWNIIDRLVRLDSCLAVLDAYKHILSHCRKGSFNKRNSSIPMIDFGDTKK